MENDVVGVVCGRLTFQLLEMSFGKAGDDGRCG